MKCATLLAMPSTPAWLHRCSITCSKQNHTDHLGSTGSRWFIVHVLPVYGMQSDFAERQLTRSAAADLHNTLTVAEHMNTLQLVCSCIPEQYAVGWRATGGPCSWLPKQQTRQLMLTTRHKKTRSCSTLTKPDQVTKTRKPGFEFAERGCI